MGQRFFKAVDKFILDERKIWAIREYRKVTGADLAIAERYVNERTEILRRDFPEKLEETPPAIDQEKINLMSRIDDSELREIRSICSEIQKVTTGVNYTLTLDVSGVRYPDNDLPVNEFMTVVCPGAKPHLTQIQRLEQSDFRRTVASDLSTEGEPDCGPNFTPARSRKLNDELLPEYFKKLNSLAPATTFHRYHSSDGIPGYYTFWYHVFILRSRSTNTILLVSAVASD